jgi:hypothetical protein
VREKIYLQRARQTLKTLKGRVHSERYFLENVVKKMAKDGFLAGGSLFPYIQTKFNRLVEIEEEIKKSYFETYEITLDTSGSNFEELYSSEKIQIYRGINDKLWEIEKQIRKDVERHFRQCESMVSDGSIDDWEMSCSICFYLDENDPDFMQDDDNILANLKFDAKLEFQFQEDWGLFDGNNHNEYRRIDGHPLQGEHHCFLFHQLYDHTELDWDDLPRIDSIWVDIKVIHQHFYKLKSHDDKESDSIDPRENMRGE